ncbi:MAG: hypothetical protein M0P12_03365 [Paludibacteraceae bacterium]|nr:hypothetical protein [Paludibacteraceae bacterium]
MGQEPREPREPRWEYDCFHCKLSWCCGPSCACSPKNKPNPERRVYSVWLKGHAGVASPKYEDSPIRGLGAEVKPSVVKKGMQIEFRLCGKPWKKGIVTGFREYGAICVDAC